MIDYSTSASQPLAGADRDQIRAFLKQPGRDDGLLYMAALNQITRSLRFTFRSLSTDETHDIAMDAIERVVSAAAAGNLDLSRNVAGYLHVTARNAALDFLRRAGREVPLPESLFPDYPTDDDVASIVERHATAAAVEQALADAIRDGDRTLVRVVTYVLDVAEKSGQLPSNRSAAQALNLSHTGVADALARLRRYLVRYVEAPG